MSDYQTGHNMTSPVRSDYQTGRNMTSPPRLCLVRLGQVRSNNLTGLILVLT